MRSLNPKLVGPSWCVDALSQESMRYLYRCLSVLFGAFRCFIYGSCVQPFALVRLLCFIVYRCFIASPTTLVARVFLCDGALPCPSTGIGPLQRVRKKKLSSDTHTPHTHTHTHTHTPTQTIMEGVAELEDGSLSDVMNRHLWHLLALALGANSSHLSGT